MTETAWYGHKNRHVDHCTGEDAETTPGTFSYLIFDKGAKNIHWIKDSLFNKWCRENWLSICRRFNLDLNILPCTKLKTKWIKELNVKTETTTGDKMGTTPQDIGIGKNSEQNPNNIKNQHKGSYQVKKLLCSKGNNQQNEETTYRMGKFFSR